MKPKVLIGFYVWNQYVYDLCLHLFNMYLLCLELLGEKSLAGELTNKANITTL